jgi:hypothetical protein
MLVMVDQSRWEIPAGENSKTLIWSPTARLRIEEDSEDEAFPYRITNLDTYGEETVPAKKLR